VSDDGKATAPPGATGDATEPFSFERLPQRRNGYDIEATDALLGRFSERCGALAGECASLREEVARLESDLAKRRDREQSVTDALIAARQHAEAIVDDARREAEEIVSNAHAGAEARADLDRLQHEREEAQRELERLQRIQREVHSGLSTFLLRAVELVQADDDDQAGPRVVVDGDHWANAVEADFDPEGIR
jgi:cell division septum initiation protein DivIVA